MRHESLLLMRGLRSVMLLLLLAMTACTSLPPTSSVEPDGWQRSLEQRGQLTRWTLKGRLGVQTESDGGSLDLFWRQHGAAYTIRLIAPLGQGTLLIKGDGRAVMFQPHR